MVTIAPGPGRGMAKKKLETAQVRVAKVAIDLARVVGAHYGKDPGDFITDFLLAELPKLEKKILAERARAMGLEVGEPEESPTKGRKGK